MAKRGTSQYKSSQGLGISTTPTIGPTSSVKKPAAKAKAVVTRSASKRAVQPTVKRMAPTSGKQAAPKAAARPTVRYTLQPRIDGPRSTGGFDDIGKFFGEVASNLQGAAASAIPGVRDLQRASGGIVNATKLRRR